MMILKILLGILIFIIAIVSLYFIVAFFGAIIPIHRRFQNQKDGIDIFLASNGMHVDFVLPIQNTIFDWPKVIGNSHYAKDLYNYTYLGIGWGDEGFFLKVESWDNVPKKLGARALLLPTPSLMRVTGYDQLPAEKIAKKVSISQNQYLQLCNFIYKKFALDANQKTHLIPEAGKTENDNYYRANGYYHCFYTCNNWVNEGLKKTGIRTSLWSPMAKAIMVQLDKIKPKASID